MARSGAMVLVALLACTMPAPASAAGSLYAGPAADPLFTTIMPRLLTALFPDQRLDGMEAADSVVALGRVAGDASSAALADLAAMVNFIAAKKLPPERLEFHGSIGAHCLLGFARRDGWVRSFGDIAATDGTPRPRIGLAGPDAVVLSGILRQIDPRLAGVAFKAGTADEGAAQVVAGTSDLLLLVAQPDLDRALIQRLADNDQLVLLPVATRLLLRAAVDRSSGFILQPVQSDSGLTPWSRRPVTTLCSPTGVVIRADAPAALRDAVNRAVPVVAASLEISLVDQALGAARGTMNDALDGVQGLIGRFRSR